MIDCRRVNDVNPLPQPVRTLLEDKAYGHVVTVTATGRPRVTMARESCGHSGLRLPIQDDGQRSGVAFPKNRVHQESLAVW